MCIYMYHSVSVEFRGSLAKAALVFVSCGSLGLNSGCQPWPQVPLPAEPSVCSMCLYECSRAKFKKPLKV